jgi:predicted polyphosphate/ATP-dependent NAD kinase
MKGSGCEMIVFCGGDGTARDVFEAVGSTVPILGIPAGVKMYSGVFAITPRAGAQLLAAYARGEASLGEAEITDIDEGAYRKDIVSTSLYGIAKTIYEPLLVPASKEAVVGPEEDAYKEDIARTVIESMEDDTLYIFGAGSTTARIMESMGLEHTLLGIDGAMNGKLVTKDADEATLLRLLESPVQVRLILSPLGAKGVLIGRGTGPLTPAVMKRIGIDNVVAVATPLKLSRLKQLLVDTGNKELDERFSKKGYLSVINGYRTSTIKK